MTQIHAELLKRRVEKILPSKKGLEKLLSLKKIRLYNGIDPTGKKLHLGHTVGIRKLMEFAELGHEVILVFGTGTVAVGDPSQRETGRKLITQEEIIENIKNWKKQVTPIVDFNKVKIMHNGDWILKLTLDQIINIASNISAVQLFKRDMFQKRLEKGDTVWYHETMYPLLQGYDSVVLDVDLEIGGSDQEFNMLIGRELQRKINGKEKYILTWPMIMGTDGKKMSKSLGNCIYLTDKPDDMFGKTMSLPDSQIIPYFELASNATANRVEKAKNDLEKGINPSVVKEDLAFCIVEEFHGIKTACDAREYFRKAFRKGSFPKTPQMVKLDHGKAQTIADVVSLKTKSKAQAKRLILQGAVDLNGQTVRNQDQKVEKNDNIKIGKKIFIKTC